MKAPSTADGQQAPTLWSSRRLRSALLRHYDRHRRPLPWRLSPDPYRIWISEVMLQQTQVATVLPRWAAFVRRFPRPAQLAAASEHEVLAEWAGLGYYRRARQLHRAAQQVVAEHGGRLPSQLALLRRLPGVGPYTAGAIASCAFGARVPAVDGNVERVLSRLMALQLPPHSGPGRRQIWAQAAALADGPRPGDVNQALMDLGAQICRPRQPACLACPLRGSCRARWLGCAAQLPPPAARPSRQQLTVAYAYAPAAAGGAGAWLWRRPLGGLWPGLWEPPSAAAATAEAAMDALAARLGRPLPPPLAQLRHLLTHREVTALIFWLPPDRFAPGPQDRWVDDWAAQPLSTLARRALQLGRQALGQPPLMRAS